MMPVAVASLKPQSVPTTKVAARHLRRPAAALLSLLLLALGVFVVRPNWVLDQQVHFKLWRAHAVSGYVAIADGNRLHYYEVPPSSGAPGIPLLLIHGLGSRGDDWSRLIPTFAAAGFHIYAPDLLGYGRSSRPTDADYSIALEEKVVLQFMQAKRIRKASVIGWSMGGWVAMALALDHPALVDRLAVYDTAGTYFPAVIPPGLFTPDDLAGVQRLVDVLEPAPRHVPTFYAIDSLRRLQSNAWVVNRSLASMVGGRYLLDFRLHRLTQPMLIMWGGTDRLIPPAVGASIHQAVPHSRYTVVEGCGHLAPAECAKPFLETTIAFLKAQPPLPPGEFTLPQPR